MHRLACLAAGLVVGLPVVPFLSSPGDEPPGPPAREPAIDRYWGEQVVDPFRNLERLEDPAVLAWVSAQNAHALAELDAHPAREAIEQRVAALSRADSPLYFDPHDASGRTFFLEKRAGREQLALVAFDDVRNRSTRVTILDPTRIDPSGRTAIDLYAPSPDGGRVAVSLSSERTEAGTLHVFDVRSGEEIGERIRGVYSGTALGSVAWDASGEGFFYTRHPLDASGEPSPFDQRIHHHTLGDDPATDPMVLGDAFPSIAEIELERSADGRHHLARVAEGDGGTYAFWLRGPGGTWRRIAEPSGLVERAGFADDAIYLLSRENAPTHKLLRLPLGAGSVAEAEVVIDAGPAVIADFAVTDTRIYVVEAWGGRSRLRVHGIGGTALDLVEMGDVAHVSGLTALAGDEVLFRSESHVEPPAWYLYSPSRRRPARSALVHESPASFTDVEVRREQALADDGTAIPITIMAPRGLVLNGRAPALLRGYGAYGKSLEAGFNASNRLWLDQGGVIAFAHVRGGGELGDAWHRAATRERKKRSVEDFALAARHLIAAGYTSPERLAIEGGSAGGLLVYAAMVLHPLRFAAVVAHAGVADMLRAETAPNGAFNVPELGTVENETHFRGMYAYSPYHNVFDDETYPAVLSLAGLNDVRVEPWHALKMTARLLETDTTSRVLLRVDDRGGHAGTRLSDRDRVRADVFTFLIQELDIEFRTSAEIATAD